jgi:hypothetical protein
MDHWVLRTSHSRQRPDTRPGWRWLPVGIQIVRVDAADKSAEMPELVVFMQIWVPVSIFTALRWADETSNMAPEKIPMQ